MDALGFKGIWGRHAPEEVLSSLRSLRDNFLLKKKQNEEAAAKLFREQFGPDLPIPHQTEVFFLSDTVLITTTHQGEFIEDSACTGALLIASAFTGAALTAKIPLLFRGCIVRGEFEVEYPFCVGPAVDRAAELAAAADGPFVWCDPDVAEQITTFEARRDQYLSNAEPAFAKPVSNWISYAVPLKDGRTFETMVVNPLRTVSPKHRANAIERAEATFTTNSLDVWIKKKHCMHFLNACLNACQN